MLTISFVINNSSYAALYIKIGVFPVHVMKQYTLAKRHCYKIDLQRIPENHKVDIM